MPYFSAASLVEQKVASVEFETVLQIVKPSFDERLKWTFSDGTANVYADIEDEDSFAQVQRRERKCARGDLLRVLLSVESFVSETGQISNVRVVKRVIEQLEPPKQLPLV